MKKIIIVLLAVNLYSTEYFYQNLNRYLLVQSKSIEKTTLKANSESSSIYLGYNGDTLQYNYDINDKNTLIFSSQYQRNTYLSFSENQFNMFDLTTSMGYQYHYKLKKSKNNLVIGILGGYHFTKANYYRVPQYQVANQGFFSAYGNFSSNSFHYIGTMYYNGGTIDVQNYVSNGDLSTGLIDTYHSSVYGFNNELYYSFYLGKNTYISPLLKMNFAYILHGAINDVNESTKLPTANSIDLYKDGLYSAEPAVGIKIDTIISMVNFNIFFNYSYEVGNLYTKQIQSNKITSNGTHSLDPVLGPDEKTPTDSYNVGFNINIHNIIYKNVSFKASYEYKSRFVENFLYIGFAYKL